MLILCFKTEDEATKHLSPSWYINLEQFISKLDEVKISPNPAKNILYIQTGNSNSELYQVIDVYGNILMEGSLLNNFIDIESLNAGVYYLKLHGKVNVQKFIKI